MDPPLKNLTALALDCQTTGSNAGRDHVIEIGWVSVGPVSGPDREKPASFLVRLPDDVELPPAVTKLTGVQLNDLQTAFAPGQIWTNLMDACAALPSSPPGPGGVLLIHYAPFERPFLEQLHATHGNGEAFPFRIVCTHAIARRLLPRLPRCGLRALAGYFGLKLGDRKRAAGHAAATRDIWEQMLPMLAEEGIDRWSTLMGWMGTPATASRVRRDYPMPRTLRLKAPDQPGVYRLRRTNGDLLYVGKARSLKRRINSYFQTRRRHSEHILEMLSQARHLDYICTPTALEAALLECDLIQQHRPPYNIMLKPGDRTPVFYSPDFQAAGVPGDPHLSVGPIPSAQALTAFCFIVTQCGRRNPVLPEETAALAEAFGIPAPYLPPRDALADGLGWYRQNCGHCGDFVLTARKLLGRGMRLWRRPKAGAEAPAEDSEAETAATGSGGEWTPPAVIDMLDGIVRRGSHLVRRGRWLTILANAAVHWDTGPPGTARRQVLIVSQGHIDIMVGPTAMACRNAAPPTVPSRQACRQIFQSAATYDRLRVLTTEIRRLAGEDRPVKILPAVGGPIAKRGLGRLLNFI